jgi:cobalt-zinc-cadmium efflux system membrane fusion protein
MRAGFFPKGRRVVAMLAALATAACARGVAERTAEGARDRDEPAVAGEPRDAHDHDHAVGGERHDAHDHGAHEKDEALAASEEGFVELSAAERETAGIRVGEASVRTIRLEQELPGEIAVNADRLAHVVPRFAGIAREIRKNLGDAVRANEVLAVLESNEGLSLYEVKSLIDGTVIEKHITLGEFVSDEQDIYVVADLSTVWVNVTVYARDLERVRAGQPVHIHAAGVSEEAQGRIEYVGPIVGEATRTAVARVVLPNPRGTWRPGLFVSARVRTDDALVPVAVADGALQTVQGLPVVFVEEPRGFRARPVRTGRTDGEWVEIVAGLSAGERVAEAESFLLKSELLKSEAAHGHQH